MTTADPAALLDELTRELLRAGWDAAYVQRRVHQTENEALEIQVGGIEILGFRRRERNDY